VVTLLIIADDFTGALDTGVQFAAKGIKTRVVTSASYDLRRLDPSVQVLVIDAETRHLPQQKAYDIVYDIAKRAADLNIPYLYKKTDSALRGNIGSELTAMMDAAEGKTLSFIPAYPKMKRRTKEGIHYIDGVPVNESVFGKDPLEPVTCSYIPQIIKSQSQVKVRAGVSAKNVGKQSVLEKRITEGNKNEPEIIVWDAETDNELEKVGSHLYETGQMYLTAGCAGFAAVLPKLFGLNQSEIQEKKLTPKLMVICGSINPITEAQLDHAENHGFFRYRLNMDEMLGKDYWLSSSGQHKLDRWRKILEQQSCMILDSNDMTGWESIENYIIDNGLNKKEISFQIAASYGHILKALIDGGLESTIMIIGGDTLLGCMEELKIKEMEPVCELASGVVLSEFFLGSRMYQVISKSGGFGEETLITELAHKIIENAEKDMS